VNKAAAAIVMCCASACMPMTGGPGGGGSGGPMPDMTRVEHLNSGTRTGIEGFTQVVRMGPTVYVSGQVALDAEGNVVGAGDLRAQAQRAFENLSHALQISGAIPSEVARLTVYVVGLEPGDWDMIREVGARFFPQRNPPAGTVVGVAALPRDGLLIAVDAVAVVRASFRPREERE
jgi:enamine deaminase RidA (YjgF/YER057c/UK114 family)